jgi:hypothetical protein
VPLTYVPSSIFHAYDITNVLDEGGKILGLFINNHAHPDVFKSQEEIKEPNQAYMRQDFMTELLMQQQETNVSLQRAFEELKNSYLQKEATQSNQMNQIGSQISDLKVSNHHHEQIENQMLQWLKMLDEKNLNLQTILEKELLQKSEVVTRIKESNQEIMVRLEQQEDSYEKLTSQINEQLEHQKEAAVLQEEFQGNVLRRLDSQEALTEKIHRQLNYIRSILFERTNYLAEKVEDGYKITSSYVYKLMTGSEQPLTFFLLNQKKEENQKHSD